MVYLDIDPIAEVRRNRELLLARHGNIENLHKHMEKERKQLEKDGWKFISIREVLAKKHNDPRERESL